MIEVLWKAFAIPVLVMSFVASNRLNDRPKLQNLKCSSVHIIAFTINSSIQKMSILNSLEVTLVNVLEG